MQCLHTFCNIVQAMETTISSDYVKYKENEKRYIRTLVGIQEYGSLHDCKAGVIRSRVDYRVRNKNLFKFHEHMLSSTFSPFT